MLLMRRFGARLIFEEEPGVCFAVFFAVADGMGENRFVIRLPNPPLVKQAAALSEYVLVRKAVGAIVSHDAFPILASPCQQRHEKLTRTPLSVARRTMMRYSPRSIRQLLRGMALL